MSKLVIDNDFIIDGSGSERVSPNFRLREFIRPNGVAKVHLDLIAALQLLRTQLNRPLSIESMSPRDGLGAGETGLFAFVQSKDNQETIDHAHSLKSKGYFQTVTPCDNDCFVSIGDPVSLPAMDEDNAMECCLTVTSGFETSGDPFQQVTGNFDGAGLSFGPSQVNFKSGTLPQLFNRFIDADEAALQECFDGSSGYDEFLSVLSQSRAGQIKWADSLSRGNRKHGFAQPWKRRLQRIGREERFRRIMVAYSLEKYGEKLKKAFDFLKRFSDIPVTHLRCISALYDLCTQQGSLNKAESRIKRRFDTDPPDDQFELVRVACVERGHTASKPWRADCASRRLGILNRRPTRVEIDGTSSQRGNGHLYLLRNVEVKINS